MGSSFNLRQAHKELKKLTASIRPDPRPDIELAERDHLQELFLRLVPVVYEYSGISIEDLVRGVAFRVSAAETEYLVDRLSKLRRKHDQVVVTRGDESVLLPLRPDFDPRQHPLAAVWSDGGYYTARERNHSNSAKLRKLGLRDGIQGYVSFRALVLQPSLGHAAWQSDPQELAAVTSSYEAEALAALLGLESLVERLESERNLPPVATFQVVLFSDCQSLIEALKNPPSEKEKPEAASERLVRLRELAALFAGFYPQWEDRRRIKQRLGH